MKKRIIVILAVLVWLLECVLVMGTRAEPLTFVSPVPWCGPGVPQPCLPWRPTPEREQRIREETNRPGISVEMLRRGECVVRARTWGVDEARCK
jgi:hypothetical protein